MSKTIVFISHIGDEAKIAAEFKSLVEENFLNLINVFVSSDGISMAMGRRWLDEISVALKDCAIEIVICSPISIQRPWINFEAGAGWVREIPVIPLCHSGMTPSDLPIPLNMLQASTATEAGSLENVFRALAQAIGSTAPKIDFTDFIAKVKRFEDEYTFWNKCNIAFEALNDQSRNIANNLKVDRTAMIFIPVHLMGAVWPHLEFLRNESILAFKMTGSYDKEIGICNGFELSTIDQFDTITNDPQFQYEIQESNDNFSRLKSTTAINISEVTHDINALSNTKDTVTKNHPFIEVLNGPKTGQVLPIDKPVTTIGRPGIQISAITARLDGYYLMHIESNDDVGRPCINGASIGDKPKLIKNGDVLRVSHVDFTFNCQ